MAANLDWTGLIPGEEQPGQYGYIPVSPGSNNSGPQVGEQLFAQMAQNPPEQQPVMDTSWMFPGGLPGSPDATNTAIIHPPPKNPPDYTPYKPEMALPGSYIDPTTNLPTVDFHKETQRETRPVMTPVGDPTVPEGGAVPKKQPVQPVVEDQESVAKAKVMVDKLEKMTKRKVNPEIKAQVMERAGKDPNYLFHIARALANVGGAISGRGVEQADAPFRGMLEKHSQLAESKDPTSEISRGYQMAASQLFPGKDFSQKSAFVLEKTLPHLKSAAQANATRLAAMSKGRMTPVQEYNIASKLRSDYEKKAADFNDISSTFKRMDAVWDDYLANKKDNGSWFAIDQALITLYNKMLDPNSVVRESEYARTPENASRINKMMGGILQLKKGGAGLMDEDREELVRVARLLNDSAQDRLYGIQDDFADYTKRKGLDIRDVIFDYKKRQKRGYSPKNEGTRPKRVFMQKPDGTMTWIAEKDVQTALNRKWKRAE